MTSRRLEVRVEGQREPDAPRVLTSLHCGYIVRGPVKPEALERSIHLSLGRDCSVGNKVRRSGVVVTTDHRVGP